MNIIPNLLNYPEQQPPSSVSLVLQHGQKIHPQQFECTLISYVQNGLDVTGKILITDFRCIFMTTKETLYDQNRLIFDIPIGYISKCESSNQMVNKSMVFYADLSIKFGFTIRVKSLQAQFTNLGETINIYLGSKFRTIAQQIKIENQNQERDNKDDSLNFIMTQKYYDLHQNWENLQKWNQSYGKYNDQTAQMYENVDWSNLPLYPARFRVPKPFIGKRLTTERILFLSYSFQFNKNKHITLWRTGPGRSDPSQDQWVPKAAKSLDHFVVQIKNKTLGSGKTNASQILQLDSPSNLRQSLNKMLLASFYTPQGEQQQFKWIVHANNSRWYQQLELILSQSYLIYEKISNGINVSMLSEWDVRGAQISSLVQIISKPQYRTIKGFGYLIQKQFLGFGNYFSSDNKKQRNQDKGIALIQFLDCIYQLMNLYPLSFEFNEDFLAYLALNIYSRKYGNFLYFTRVQYHFPTSNNSVVPTTTFIEQKDKKKQLFQILIRCNNIWAYFNQNQKHYKYYVNPFYVGHKQCDVYELKKKVTMKNFKIWGSLFLRDVMIYGQRVQCNHILQKHRQISQRYLKIKVETDLLRTKISKQHKQITEKKNLLKQLKKNHLD